MTSLGSDCYTGTINCKRVNAENPGGDPHKVVGNLEVTGDLQVDGGITVLSTDLRGLSLKSSTFSNQVNIGLNDNTSTWSISADANSGALFFNHILNSAGSGSQVAYLARDFGTGQFYSEFPRPIFKNMPTSPAGLPSGSVWSNNGVLNITPP